MDSTQVKQEVLISMMNNQIKPIIELISGVALDPLLTMNSDPWYNQLIKCYKMNEEHGYQCGSLMMNLIKTYGIEVMNISKGEKEISGYFMYDPYNAGGNRYITIKSQDIVMNKGASSTYIKKGASPTHVIPIKGMSDTVINY